MKEASKPMFTAKDIQGCFIRWWEWPLLFFIPTKTVYDPDGTISYKRFRGKTYLLKVNVIQ